MYSDPICACNALLVNTMAFTPNADLQSLQDQLDAARAADVPDLAEIRKYKNRVIEYLARCTSEHMSADEDHVAGTTPLQLISTESPLPCIPRGICSPLKTPEIRRFEKLFREAFGDIESCTTSWPD